MTGFDYAQWARWYVKRSPRKAAKFLTHHADKAEPEYALKVAALRAEFPNHNRCSDCGRPLEKGVSVERGVGPDCWAKRQAAS